MKKKYLFVGAIELYILALVFCFLPGIKANQSTFTVDGEPIKINFSSEFGLIFGEGSNEVSYFLIGALCLVLIAIAFAVLGFFKKVPAYSYNISGFSAFLACIMFFFTKVFFTIANDIPTSVSQYFKMSGGSLIPAILCLAGGIVSFATVNFKE